MRERERETETETERDRQRQRQREIEREGGRETQGERHLFFYPLLLVIVLHFFAG